ncbi:MAG: glycerol-3-phosphate 1-O-acyltransferase PlsY [Oscillospiraceae bacterium]|nr:glycerol-3-phosphate 1-O-acyltransferase PlsY [Oscillospiraceae bacterium]
MVVVFFLLVALGAYFLGGLNGAIITSRLVYRQDIRRHGSGNAGLTNFWRTYGGHAVFLLILIDVIKTALPVVFGGLIFESILTFGTVEERLIIGRTWGGLFAVFGHAYPCLYGFKGGKGILSGGTVAIFIDLRVAAVVWGIFFIVVLLTRYVSLGSMLAGSSLPIAFIIFGLNIWATLLIAVIAVFVVARHRDNLIRLLRREEPKIGSKKRSTGG